MSLLPDGFTFSQGSLQDYVDCPRRFELRYLLQLSWPAVESEPARENERLLLQGTRFHLLIHQYLLGLSRHQLSTQVQDADLQRWWDAFLNRFDNDGAFSEPSTGLFPEASLTATLAGFRLVAKCDLIRIGLDGRLTIYDWKTSRTLPRRVWLKERLQTRLYPYLLVRSGTYMSSGNPVTPHQVEMVYWYADAPDELIRFQYSEEQYRTDGDYLTGLISRIQSHGLGEFPLTDKEERCRYCTYRSLCGRGIEAGALADMDADFLLKDFFDIEIKPEEISEIEY